MQSHRDKTVVHELHVVDQVEHVTLDDIGVVGLRRNQQGKRHFVPLRTRTGIYINAPPRIKPKTFRQGQFRIIGRIIATQDTFESSGVHQRENRIIMVHRMPALFGDHHLFSRCIAQAQGGFALRQLWHHQPVQVAVEQRTGRRLGDVAQLGRDAEMIVELIHIAHTILPEIRHLVDGLRLEGSKDIVLVRRQQSVRRSHDIVTGGHGNGVPRKFLGGILFFQERIFYFPLIFPFPVPYAVGHIPLQEKVRVEVGRRLRTGAQTYLIDKIG